MAETIGVTKSITMSGTTYPNAFATIKAINIQTGSTDIGVVLAIYTDQAYSVSNPTDPLAIKTFYITLTAQQHETVYNTVYSRLISQVPAFNGATQVT